MEINKILKLMNPEKFKISECKIIPVTVCQDGKILYQVRVRPNHLFVDTATSVSLNALKKLIREHYSAYKQKDKMIWKEEDTK